MADWLKKQLARLLVLPFGPESIDEHVKALADIPEPILTAAVDYALKTRARFPAPAELRVDADHVAPLVVLDVPIPTHERELDEPFTITIPEVGKVVSITREWIYDCDDCSDTGWKSFWCGEKSKFTQPWIPFARCERHHEHTGHEFVKHCACWDSNPTLVRRRDAMKKYSEQPRKVG